MMDVRRGEWSQHTLPDLRKARSSHSSCCVKNQIFVFGGTARYNKFLNSIEVLKLGEHEWALIKNSDFA